MFKKLNSQIIFILALFILTLQATAQNDPEAIKILNKFSANAQAAPSVSMKFDLVTVDQAENTENTLTGSIILSKDNYRLELPDNITWFNGETSWSYLPAEKEVTVTKPDKKDHSFQNRPSAIFSIYKSGYKCTLVEEGSDSYVIDLYPEDIKSDILRLRISIDKSNMNLRNLEYKKRDGLIVTLIVKEYDLKVKPDQESFVFQPNKYKGVDVIDMR